MVTLDPQQLLVSVAQILDRLGISYAITGGMSVVVWGRPRFTADIDVVIAPTDPQVDGLIAAFHALGEGVYVDDEMIRNVHRNAGEFNIIDTSSGVKVDFWVGKNEMTRVQLARRVPQAIGGVDVYFLSPEDLIISKLVWFQKSESTRHLEDIESVLAISGDRVDRNYVADWAERLGVADLWLRVCEKSRPVEAGSFVYSSAVAREQGPRPWMEDCHVVLDRQQEKGLLYCGVYDGHGGDKASTYARDRVAETVFRVFDQGKTPAVSFQYAYETVAKEIHDAHAGTCALDVLLASDGTVWFAHVGDSRLLIVNGKGVKQITTDHRVGTPSERERIERAGGLINGRYVVKGEYGLEVTRALGDAYFYSVGVISTPESGTYQLEESDQWLILATDGLFDVVSHSEIAETIRTAWDEREALEALKHKALVERKVKDNVTVILVKISHVQS